MSDSDEPTGNNHMLKAIRLRADRSERWQREGERSLWANLSMVGALGWLIIIPTLIGVAAGRWLDRSLDTGVTFTGAFIFLGVIAGGLLAWHRMNER